jgi:hypothetical protein
MLLQIVMEEVIGWDMRKNWSTGKPGLFGICIAVSLAFEEQSRTTVHSHGTAWMEKLREKQHETFFGNYQEKREATALLSRFHECVTTTSLMETDLVRTACNHPCVVKNISDRSQPEVVPDQQLRILRHKKGYQALEGVFVKCPHCSKGFTNETLLNDYIHNHTEFVACSPCLPAGQTKWQPADDGHDDVKPKAQMFARIIKFQRKKNASVEDDTPVMCINASYQHHASCYVRGCFKCNKLKKSRSHKCGPNCECRFCTMLKASVSIDRECKL